MRKFFGAAVLLILAGCGLQANLPRPAPKLYRDSDYRSGEIHDFELQSRIPEAWNEGYREAGHDRTRTVGKTYWAFKNMTSQPLRGMRVVDVVVVDSSGLVRERAVDLIVVSESVLNERLNVTKRNVALNEPWDIQPRKSFELWVEFTLNHEEIRTGEDLSVVLVLGLDRRAACFRTDPLAVKSLRR